MTPGATAVLPDLTAMQARRMSVCVREPADHGHLASLAFLRASDAFEKRRPVYFSSGCRPKGHVHRVIVSLLPEGRTGWHVHFEIRALERAQPAKAEEPLLVDPSTGSVHPPERLPSVKLTRLVGHIGRRLAGTEIHINGSAAFRFPANEYRAVMPVPAPLLEPQPPDVPVGIDIMGVRLGWRDGSRSIIVDTAERPPRHLRVSVEVRDSAVTVGENWLCDVLEHLRQCIGHIVLPLLEE